MARTLFFSVGEPSGDLHGANLARALRLRAPDIQCVGFGGPRMQEAGCQLHFDLTQLAVMWLGRVLVHLPTFLSLLRQADAYFKATPPDAVILIDYPGFNWWVARRAKARGIPVIYYGAPQLWAWAPWRVAKIRRFVDHLLCKLPFEPDWFAARGCQAYYVGHPYFDELAERRLDQEWVRTLRDASSPLVVLLPGSRRQEVLANLPGFLRAAAFVHQRVPQARFAVASLNASQAAMAMELEARLQGSPSSTGLPCQVFSGRTAELIEAADVCLACSGSVSLETLYHAKPTVIGYRIGRVAYGLQHWFRTSRFITLVNLLATDRLARRPGEPNTVANAMRCELAMPEFLSCSDASAEMAQLLVRWLTEPAARQAAVERLTRLKQRFAHPGASERAADYITRMLGCPAVDREEQTVVTGRAFADAG